MTSHHLNSFQDYTEQEVFDSIQHLIKKDNTTYTAFQKRLMFADLIKFINTDRLLMPTVIIAEDFNFIQDLSELNKLVDQIPPDQDYSWKDSTQLRAIAFSEIIIVNLFLQQIGRPPEDTPELQINYSNKAVESNSEEILEHLKRAAYLEIADNTKNTGKGAKDKFKAIISSMASIDYANNTSFFRTDKEFLKDIKDNLPEENAVIDQPARDKTLPSFFKSQECFKLFEDYAANFIIDPYADYSFIYQKLKKDKLIDRIPHLEFMLWLNAEGYTNEKEFDLFLEKESFRSLGKCNRESRRNIYDVLKAKYFEND